MPEEGQVSLLNFISRSPDGLTYAYEPRDVEFRVITNDLTHIWKEEGYEEENGELVLTERRVILRTGEELTFPEIMRRLAIFPRPVEQLGRLIRLGFVRRVVRVTRVPVYVRRRLVFRRVIRVLYRVERDFSAMVEVDRMRIITVSFHTYPTGRYPGGKWHPRELVVRLEKEFRLGERPPLGMTWDEVLDKVNWEEIEDELIEKAKEVLMREFEVRDLHASVEEEVGWWWYVPEDLATLLMYELRRLSR